MGQKESKISIFLTSLLVIAVMMLSFSAGVLSGKSWSDRNHKIQSMEMESMGFTMDPNSAVGQDITEEQITLLTEKSLQKMGSTLAPSSSRKKTKKETPRGKNSLEQISSYIKNQLGLGDKASPKPTPGAPFPKSSQISYTVRVASYKSLKQAQNHCQKLIKKGYPAYPLRTVINGDNWYRVSIGSFKNKKQAIQYYQNLKTQAPFKNSFIEKIP